MGARYKTYADTGIAPNGVWDAGDVNAIQDMKADNDNAAQTIRAIAFQIVDTTLQLIKYAAGQIQLTGMLRVTKGVQPGTFTNATRNALTSGNRPEGMLFYNSDAKRVEFNKGTDTSPDYEPVGLIPVTGMVNADGTIAAGSGFTVNRTGTGAYTITFTTAFSVAPTVLVASRIGGYSGNQASVTNSTTTTVTVYTNDYQGNAADTPFNFLAALTL